ncbi:MAG TPA: branched-chain amino acid ABC transporter substrate-binding protein [Acidimicrobiales bacterium]|nr:branched-chain amino acid ABC transporter substrate-binding protein [Acidimicrobiales bacterium]
MHRRLTRFGPLLIAVALVLGTSQGVASANKSHSSEPTYTIAYDGPLSGGNAQLGRNMKYAVELAIKWANEGKTFGKLPFKLKYAEQDDQGLATVSPTSAEALVTNPSVMAVVGPAFFDTARSAEPIFWAADLATVSPSVTNPLLAEEGWDNFFRVVADDNAQGPYDADYVAKALKVKSVYSVNVARAYDSGLAGAFDTRLKHDGVAVTHQTAPGTTQCQAGTGDVQEYGALASLVVSSKAPLLFYAGDYCDFALFAKALRAAGYRGQLMSDNGSLDPRYVSSAGKTVADGTLITCACSALQNTPEDNSFELAFKQLAGFPSGTYTPEAFDATNVIIDAMKSLGTHITRAKIVAALHKVTYVGLTKTIHFRPNGNISDKTIFIYKVENGKIVELGSTLSLIKSFRFVASVTG